MSLCPAGCGAEIRYVRMASGKRNPVEPEPDDERGNVVVRRGVGKQLTAEQAAAARAEGIPLYLSHLASCPRHRAAEEEKRIEKRAQRRRKSFSVVRGGAA